LVVSITTPTLSQNPMSSGRGRGKGKPGCAGAVLEIAAPWRNAWADRIARRARAVALATLSGHTAVEVAIVDRAGLFLAWVGDGGG
jgi:hypothetical protein